MMHQISDLDRAIMLAVGKTGGLGMRRIKSLFGEDAEEACTDSRTRLGEVVDDVVAEYIERMGDILPNHDARDLVRYALVDSLADPHKWSSSWSWCHHSCCVLMAMGYDKERARRELEERFEFVYGLLDAED